MSTTTLAGLSAGLIDKVRAKLTDTPAGKSRDRACATKRLRAAILACLGDGADTLADTLTVNVVETSSASEALDFLAQAFDAAIARATEEPEPMFYTALIRDGDPVPTKTQVEALRAGEPVDLSTTIEEVREIRPRGVRAARRAEAEASAARGEVPTAPSFAGLTYERRWQPHIARLQVLADAGDPDALADAPFRVFDTPSRQIARWRELAVRALRVKGDAR